MQSSQENAFRPQRHNGSILGRKGDEMRIAIEVLQEKQACEVARRKFMEFFPFGRVTVTRRLCERHARDFDFTWAAMNLLPPTARAEYQKVCDKAFAEYLKVWARAWAEYKKACDNAWAEYQKACDKARAEYQKACYKAWAEYQKACAPAFAEYQKVCALAFYCGTRVKEGKVMK